MLLVTRGVLPPMLIRVSESYGRFEEHGVRKRSFLLAIPVKVSKYSA